MSIKQRDLRWRRSHKETPMFRCRTISLLALAVALAAVPAIADDQHHPATAGNMQGGMMGGMQGGMGAAGIPMMGMMQMMGAGMQMMSEHVEGRIAFIKTELKITDAQLPQWNAFAQAMRDNATAMQGMMGSMMGMGQGGTLPDKLATSEKQLAARLEAIRKLKAAADPLYAVLSADQKKTADEIIISPMGMMM
jgi:hypothetical protein